MGNFGASVTGLDELDRLLKVLPKRTKNKIIPSALRAGGTPIVKAMRRNLVKDVTVTFEDGKKKYKSSELKVGKEIRGRSGDKYLIVGTKTFEPFKNFPVWLEYGTLAERGKSLKKPRSKAGQALANKGVGLKKQPFARPALMQSKREASIKMGDKILSEIDNQVDKILKRGKV